MKRLFLFLTLLLSCSSFGAIARTGTIVAAATSGTFSATATNDLKVIVAFRNGSTTPPTVPAGWTTIETGTGATSSFVSACNVSSSSGDTTTGTWNNATSLAGASYSGTAVTTTANCHFDAVGAHTNGTGTSTSENYFGNFSSIRETNGTSWVVGVGMDKTNTNCTPTGMTSIVNNGTGPAIQWNDTNGGVSAWNNTTCTVTSSTWITETIEIAAATCNGNTISGNISCQQASANVLGCGVFSNALTPKILGDNVYVYIDSNAAVTAVSDSVDGAYTNVFASTSWNSGTVFTGIWRRTVSSTAVRNITVTSAGCSSSEGWFIELHSSVGTIAEDCTSTILTGAPLTNPAPGCTSTKSNDVALAWIDWANNQPTAGSGMTTVNEGQENVWEYKALSSSGAFTAPWSFSDTGITGSMALSDGAASGSAPANQFPRLQL
jgi:hypothetical protein